MVRIKKEATFTIDQREGEYLSFPDIVSVGGDGLLVVYRSADVHYPPDPQRTALYLARSNDGGRTWGPRQAFHPSPRNRDQWSWHCPRLQKLSDGRLALLCDLSAPFSAELAIYLSLSSDDGKTWSVPTDTGMVGLMPDRLVELGESEWLFTAFHWKPEGHLYQFVAASEDQGVTWQVRSIAGEDPEKLLCEGSMVRVAERELVLFMRENCMNHQPTYWVSSCDGGHTWGRLSPHPTHGHRPCADMLTHNELLLTYRNVAGTPGLAAWVGPPRTEGLELGGLELGNSVKLAQDALIIESTGDPSQAAEFFLQPLQPEFRSFELTALVQADCEGPRAAGIRAYGVVTLEGDWARFYVPSEQGGGGLTQYGELRTDGTQAHSLSLRYKLGRLSAYVDGVCAGSLEPGDALHKLMSRALHTKPPKPSHILRVARRVTFGNIGRSPPSLVDYSGHKGTSRWYQLAFKGEGSTGELREWEWQASNGRYPNHYQRTHEYQIDVETSGEWLESGYSGWTKLDDGSIYCVDYRRGSAKMPYIVGHRLRIMQ